MGVELGSPTEVNNTLVMFPERLGLVVLNDVGRSAVTERLVGGLAGGVGSGFTTFYGERTGVEAYVAATNEEANPVGLLLAVGRYWEKTGHEKEARELVAQLRERLGTKATRPKGWGGDVDIGAFNSQMCVRH